MGIDGGVQALPGATGIDILEINRAAGLLGTGVMKNIFTTAELALTGRGGARLAAEMICAKEAVAKALGTGLDGSPGWRDIELFQGHAGWQVRLHGRARQLAAAGHVEPLLATDSGGALAVAWCCLTPARIEREEGA